MALAQFSYAQKDNLFYIENAQILIYLLFFYVAYKKHPFQEKGIPLEKKSNVKMSL